MNFLSNNNIHPTETIMLKIKYVVLPSMANLAIHKDGSIIATFCIFVETKNGNTNPIVKIPDIFVIAIPSTLFAEKETTIMEVMKPSADDKKDSTIIISNEIMVNENTFMAIIDTRNEKIKGNTNLETKYPPLPRGVTDMYFVMPSSISPRITIEDAKLNIMGVTTDKNKSNMIKYGAITSFRL
jgi:hypothetical protein